MRQPCRRSAQVWHALSRNHTNFTCNSRVYLRTEWTTLLPLPSQTKLVLINRHRRNGRVCRTRVLEVLDASKQTHHFVSRSPHYAPRRQYNIFSHPKMSFPVAFYHLYNTTNGSPSLTDHIWDDKLEYLRQADYVSAAGRHRRTEVQTARVDRYTCLLPIDAYTRKIIA